MYNLLLIVKATKKGQESREKIEKSVNGLAKVVKKNEVGERKLAYPIKKETKGFYFWLDFELDKDKLPELKKKIDKEKPIRDLIVNKPKEKPVKVKKRIRKKKKIEKPPAKKRVKRKKKAKKKLVSEEKRMKDLDEKLEEIL